MKDRQNSWRVLVFLVLAGLVYQTPVFAQAKIRQIDQYMTLAHQYGQFNGSVLVADGGKVIYKRGFGMANMEWNIPNRLDTKFRLGSITKQFTAALILQLVEEDKIKLDGKLTDYLPDYRKDTGSRVTIHQLLTHTSGIPSYTGLPGFFANVSRNPYTVNEFIKQYASHDLEFEPGSKFAYNNSGYFLLGAIVEKVTGKTYEQVLKEKIFTPLGMKNSGYDHYGDILNNRAAGYQRSQDGWENAPYLDMSIPYAAGSLYSTVEDLYLWDQALYGETVLSAHAKELMFKPNLQNYGYGVEITKTTFEPGTMSVPVITHDGGINGFSTTIVRLIGRRGLIVLLDNTSRGSSLPGITEGITRILYDQTYQTPKRSIADLLLKPVLEKGATAAITQYHELKNGKHAEYDFREPELNMLGYQLLQRGKVADAIEIFKLNVAMFPKGFNTYDSLGEAYMVHGDKELAIANYKKSLELNPKNANATTMLTRLTTERKETKIDAALYNEYAGEYELGPNFLITITNEDGKLMGQATGQPKAELFPSSATEFFLKVVDAQISFVRDEQGKVSQLILHQNGRKMPARKVR